MKKITSIIILAGLSIQSFAFNPDNKKTNLMSPSGDGEKCFDESTHIINLGVGFGSRSYHAIYSGNGNTYGITPAFSFSYEQALPKKLGPGYLGIGAYGGFQHEYYNYDYDYTYNGGNKYYYHHSWNYYMIAARAAYHWDVLNSKNAEVYAGAIIGVRFQTSNYETNDPGKNDPYSYHESVAYPAYSVFAGARWYFSQHVGLFGEVGYGISYVTGGLSFKF